MPYDASNIDHVCADCGRVVSGPHKDETVPPPVARENYKGAGVSHTQCESCQMTSENERQMVARHGPNWREKAKAAGYAEKAEQKRQQRKVQSEADHAASKHWWWRKL